MEKVQHDQVKFEKAIKRLEILKGFYNHLVVYLIINLFGLLFFVIYRIAYKDKFAHLDTNLMDWINWNIILIPVFWGVGLFGHWLYAYYKKPSFLKDWEDRQMRKYMEK